MEPRILLAARSCIFAGVARTILARLLIGLGGCAFICAAIPFQPDDLRCFLLANWHVTLCAWLVLLTFFSCGHQYIAAAHQQRVV